MSKPLLLDSPLEPPNRVLRDPSRVSPCPYVIHLRCVTYPPFLVLFLFLFLFLFYILIASLASVPCCFAFRPNLFSGAFGASALALNLSFRVPYMHMQSMVTFRSILYIISWTSFIPSIKMAKLLSSLSLWLLTDNPVHSRRWLRIRCLKHCQMGVCCPHLRCTASNPQVP